MSEMQISLKKKQVKIAEETLEELKLDSKVQAKEKKLNEVALRLPQS